MEKSVYIHREGAFGDHIHMSNVIRAFHEDGWEVTACYNSKGRQIHAYNPRIAKHDLFDISDVDSDQQAMEDHYKKLNEAKDTHDKFVTLQGSLEDSLIPGEDSPEYFWPLGLRRKKNTNVCYYDQSMIWSGLTAPKYMGRTGEIWFKGDEHEFVKKYLRDKLPEDAHIILWAMRGSMWQKAMYPIAEEICNEWLDKHPESWIILTGDTFCQQWEWDHPRVLKRSGIIPFRQALHMSGYVDMVVTPETGLGIGAGAFGIPKIMLLTAASLTNIVGNDENDYSLQSDAYCSPCTRAIYNTNNCVLGGEVAEYEFHGKEYRGVKLPICVEFDKDRVLGRMEEVYENHERYNLAKRSLPPDGREVYM